MRLRTELGLPIKGGAAIQLKNISTAIEHYDPFLHQPRAFGTDWLPRRLLGSDPRGVFAGPASVRHLVRRTPPRTVLCAASRHRIVRPAPGGPRTGASHHRASAGHRHRLLPLRGGGGHHRALARGPRPQAPSGLRVPRGGTGPQRGRGAALLVAAGLAGARDHALVSLLCLNGLRVSEAVGADVERLALERGHRTLTITRKGGKVVTVPLAPRTARAVAIVWRPDRSSRRPSISTRTVTTASDPPVGQSQRTSSASFARA